MLKNKFYTYEFNNENCIQYHMHGKENSKVHKKINL